MFEELNDGWVPVLVLGVQHPPGSRVFSEHSTARKMLNTKNEEGDPPVIQLLKHRRLDLVNVLLESPEIDLDVCDSTGKNVETIAR